VKANNSDDLERIFGNELFGTSPAEPETASALIRNRGFAVQDYTFRRPFVVVFGAIAQTQLRKRSAWTAFMGSTAAIAAFTL
jgi:hypothetical protein